MATTAPALPALDNTMGVLYLSALLSMALWGAGTVQLAYYFSAYYRKDTFILKFVVFSTWLADTAGQALISQLCYTYLITNYFNPAYLGVLQPTLLPIMFVTGVTQALAQMFFVTRVWLLCSKKYRVFIAGFLTLLVTGLVVSTFVFYAITVHYTQFAQLVPLYDFMHALNVLSMITDIAIAGVLCVLLHFKRTGFKSTEHIINRLIMFSLNTGLLCALCAILTLICNIVFPNTFIYMIFYIMVCRVYVNSLLASLNSRSNMRQNDSSMNSISLSNVQWRVRDDLETHNNGGTKVHVETKTATLTDPSDDILRKD